MPHIATYVRLVHEAEKTLAESFRVIADGQAKHADIYHTCRLLADLSDRHESRLAPIRERYGEETDEDLEEPERLHAAGLAQPRTGAVGLLRDLQDLYVLATLVQTSWTAIAQAAQGLRDRELLTVATESNAETSRQLRWLNTRMKAVAPQALIVAS